MKTNYSTSRFGDNFSKVVDTTMGISTKSQSARNEFFKTGEKIGLVAAGFAALGFLIYTGYKWLTKKSEASAKIDVINAENDAEIKKINAKSEATIAEIEAQRDANIAVMKAKKEYGISNHAEQTTQEEFVITPSALNSAPQTTQFVKSDYQLLGKFLSLEDIAILYSPSGAGKSVFAYQVAIDVAMGNPSLLALDDMGLHRPQHIIYYDFEHQEELINDILGCEERPWQNGNEFLHEGYYSNEQEWLTDLDRRLSSCSQDTFVCLDNITAICSTINAEAIRRLLLFELKLRQKTFKDRGLHLTFFLVAHTNIDGLLAGTQNLTRFGTNLMKLEEYDGTNLKLTVDKNRWYGEIQHHSYLFEKCENEYGRKYDKLVHRIDEDPKPVSPVVSEPKKYDEECAARWQEMRNNGMSLRKIAAIEGCSQTTVDNYTIKPKQK